MRIKFYWYKYKSKKFPSPFKLRRAFIMLDVEPPREDWEVENWTIDMTRENSLTRPYSVYLLSALNTDYGNDKECCDDVLNIINRLEKGEIDYYEGGGQGFMHLMTPESVTFEHIIFGICPEWPSWTCPIAHYKAALEGWRRFLDIPESIDSELIIELPEVNEKRKELTN